MPQMAAEFLRKFRPDILNGSIDEMLTAGRLQDKTVLIGYLSQALTHLKTEPGPNLEYRQLHADDWVGWWIDYLKNKTNGEAGRLIPFDQIKNSLIPKVDYGTLFGGGSEGHAGHRFAIDWMLKFVHPVLLLERDAYIEGKKRGGPFLDLRARTTMWTLFNPNMTVSVLPEVPEGVNPSAHYKKLFDETGAKYCFASKSDPHVWEKVARGEFQLFTVIPDVNIQSTSDKVEKLTPDDDLERLLNTTDNVRRLMGQDDSD